jgi:hypothetical protein
MKERRTIRNHFVVRYSILDFLRLSLEWILKFNIQWSKFCVFLFNPSSLVTRYWLFCGFILLVFTPAQAEQTCKDSIIATTPSSNFTIHNDGTATHNTTGLMWMRCSLGQVWDGKACTGSPAIYTWQEGLQAGDRHEFAGYSDWRLPNKNELESIVEERCFSPAINITVFPGTPPVFFWASSPYAGFSQGAWSVDFGYGAVNASDKDGSIPVRLVRGGQ